MSSTAQELARLAETIRPETKAFIDGRFVDSASGKSFDTINPATGKADRVGVKVLADGKKVRVYKSSGEEIKVA